MATKKEWALTEEEKNELAAIINQKQVFLIREEAQQVLAGRIADAETQWWKKVLGHRGLSEDKNPGFKTFVQDGIIKRA